MSMCPVCVKWEYITSNVFWNSTNRSVLNWIGFLIECKFSKWFRGLSTFTFVKNSFYVCLLVLVEYKYTEIGNL